MELMNRIRERVVAWQKKRVRTVVFPLAGKLCAVETVEGKRLGQWQADYDGDTPNLKECFLSLKAAGLREKKLWLLVNADSLRWSRKRYPQMTAWLSYLEKELTLLAAEGTEDEGSKAVTLETEHLEEGGYWDDAMRVVLAVSHAGTALPLLMGERPFLTEENRKLRIAQGACALGAAFFLFSCVSFLSAYREDKAQLAENEALAPLKVKRAEMKKASEEEEALLAMLKEEEAKDPHWEQRLVLLADGMPQGVVLSEISAEGEDVLLKGTSQKASDLSNFTSHLTRAWGGLTELKSRKKNARTGLFEFTVRWKKETTRKSS